MKFNKNENSLKYSLLLNLVVAIIFIGFIYSSYNIIGMNNQIQDEAFQNRFQSRLYFKTISNLKSALNYLDNYIYTKDFKYIDDVEDLTLSAKADYKVLLSEIYIHSSNPNYESKESKIDEIIKNIVQFSEQKTWNLKKVNQIKEQMNEYIDLMYEEESIIWKSEAQKFYRLSEFKARSKQTFYYLTFMFTVFLAALVFFTYLRWKLINKLNEQNEQLVMHARMSTLGVMSAELAHEINSPLMVIDGRVKQLSNEFNQKEVNLDRIKKNFEIIQRNTKRIHNIVKNFKLLSKNGTIDQLETIPIEEVFFELQEIIQPRAENFQINVQIKTSTPNEYVSIRKVQILQVLVNLVNNSIDATKDNIDKWVEVSTNIENNFIQFIVTDSGNGIDQEILKKLFNPFFTTKSSSEGTGLGLSLSKKIAEDHGGNLFYNEHFLNTQFILTIPIKKKPTV